MKSQLSHAGKGLTLTLLMLGFSHKGMYGEVPVVFRDLRGYLNKAISSQPADRSHRSKQINSIFVRNTSLIILVEHNPTLTSSLQTEMRSEQIPLFISASTLPSAEAEFDPVNFRFEQNGRIWQPTANDIVPRSNNSQFGRKLIDDELHEGLILLPPWVDIHQPIKVSYLENERLMSF